MRHGVFGHLSINCDSSLEGFDKLQLLLLLYALDQSEKAPLGGSECELRVLFFPQFILFNFFFVCVVKVLRASHPGIYLFNGALQYVVKRLDPSWWMVTGCSGLVFSMRWTVGEMDSRL